MTELVEALLRSGKVLDPNVPEHRKKILIANLRAIANDLERGTSELVFTDSHGILTPAGEMDTWMLLIHDRVRAPDAERSARIVAALKSAMIEVRRTS